jgi:hypothetical protein
LLSGWNSIELARCCSNPTNPAKNSAKESAVPVRCSFLLGAGRYANNIVGINPIIAENHITKEHTI